MIDFHTYPIMIKEVIKEEPELYSSIRNILGFGFPPQPLELFLLEMKEAGIKKSILLPIDCTTRHNCKIVNNLKVAELSEKHSEFIGFASVDPIMNDSCKILEDSINKLGLKGVHLDPALQGFYIDSKEYAYPIYETCQSLGVPLHINCGLSWAPTGMVKFARPFMLDEVAYTFPHLSIIIGHSGWPWIDEALMLAIKHPNIYLDTAILYSGTPSNAYKKIFLDKIGIEVVERSLRKKVLFGSNYPRVDVRRSVKGIKNLKLSPNLEKLIFSDNAHELLEKGK